MKRKNLVIINTVAREILANYEVTAWNAYAAAGEVWRAYQASRDGEAFPGQAAFWAAGACDYIPRRGDYSCASFKMRRKGEAVPQGPGSLILALFKIMRALDS